MTRLQDFYSKLTEVENSWQVLVTSFQITQGVIQITNIWHLY